MSGLPPNIANLLSTDIGGGPSSTALAQLLQILAELVNATNAQATIISTTSISGNLGGDLAGTAANARVIATHLTAPLPVAQGGTGNTTGQPAGGAAGGDLGGTYPNPQVLATHLSAPLPTAQGGTGVSSLTGLAALQTYATGVWTPGLMFGGAATGITYGTQVGSYTQIGNLILAFFSLVLTSKGTATGAATVAGLPSPSNGSAANAGAGGVAVAYSSMASLTGAPLLQIGAGSSAVALLSAGAAATSALADTNFTNTTAIAGSAAYFI